MLRILFIFQSKISTFRLFTMSLDHELEEPINKANAHVIWDTH